MPQSSLRYGGLEVDPASIAVASVAQDHGAAVVSRGTLGTRPWDLDHVIRPRPSQATPLVLVSDAGPGGAGLDGSLPTRGHDCGGSPPHGCRTTPGTGAQPTAALPDHWPGGCVRATSPPAPSPRPRTQPCAS